jgi:hypothetical protein
MNTGAQAYFIVRAIEKAMRLCEQFVDPASYGRLRLQGVPGTIVRMLTGESAGPCLPDDALGDMNGHYDKVVLLLIDGFGWPAFRRAMARNSFLGGLASGGRLSKLAAQFPSTTACNVTTLNTGLSVAQHGVYEWLYYEPVVDDVIAPLLYSYAREQKERETLQRVPGLRPRDIYPAGSLYGTLHARGVKSYVFQHVEYAHSTYSGLVFRPARVTGYRSLKDGLTRLARRLLHEKGRAYYYFYYDAIDAVQHKRGPATAQAEASVDRLLAGLEDIFLRRAGGKSSRSAFVLMADHGQTAIDYRKTVYLNRLLPGMEKYMKRNREGRLMVPAGSCRDMFLYIEEGRLDEAIGLLRDALNGKAIVCKTSLLVENGYFAGLPVSEALAGRLGNLVILPLEGESVWWYEKGVFEIDYYGHHGGLTPGEIEVPLLIGEL